MYNSPNYAKKRSGGGSIGPIDPSAIIDLVQDTFRSVHQEPLVADDDIVIADNDWVTVEQLIPLVQVP